MHSLSLVLLVVLFLIAWSSLSKDPSPEERELYENSHRHLLDKLRAVRTCFYLLRAMYDHTGQLLVIGNTTWAPLLTRLRGHLQPRGITITTIDSLLTSVEGAIALFVEAPDPIADNRSPKWDDPRAIVTALHDTYTRWREVRAAVLTSIPSLETAFTNGHGLWTEWHTLVHSRKPHSAARRRANIRLRALRDVNYALTTTWAVLPLLRGIDCDFDIAALVTLVHNRPRPPGPGPGPGPACASECQAFYSDPNKDTLDLAAYVHSRKQQGKCSSCNFWHNQQSLCTAVKQPEDDRTLSYCPLAKTLLSSSEPGCSASFQSMFGTTDVDKARGVYKAVCTPLSRAEDTP